jgi:hypothetical protein
VCVVVFTILNLRAVQRGGKRRNRETEREKEGTESEREKCSV